MKICTIVMIISMVIVLTSCSATKILQNRSIGLINNVTYVDSTFSNPNAGNGFLVKHYNRTYAITAKHILMIAKTDRMRFVDFEGDLKQWKMHPKNDSTCFVLMDSLLNGNRKDSLTWSYMNTYWDSYIDWLVFSIKENKTNHRPLKFRSKPLIKGETLYAIGWTYKDTIGAQRFYEYKFDKTEGNYHTLIQVKGSKSLGGLSGAPIVDRKGSVVGLVSAGGEDEKTKRITVQATSLKNAFQFVSELD